MKRKIESLIEIVKRFPSGDNCQPWSFQVDSPNKINIIYDAIRSKHEFNKNDTATEISFGFLRHYLEKASNGLGYSIQIEENGYDLKVILEESQVDKSDFDLRPYINRRTDRRNFSKGYEDSILEILSNNVQADQILNFKNASKDLCKHIFSSERKLWSNSKYFADFMRWVRVSKKSYKKSRDGLFYIELNMKFFELPVIYFLKKFTQISSWLFRTPFYFFISTKINRLYKNSFLIVYSLEKFDRENIQDLSKRILDDWCYIQSQGLSYHPMNISSLPYYDDFLSSDKYTSLQAKEILDFLKKEYQIKNYPVWTARIGKCRNSCPFEMSLRI